VNDSFQVIWDTTRERNPGVGVLTQEFGDLGSPLSGRWIDVFLFELRYVGRAYANHRGKLAQSEPTFQAFFAQRLSKRFGFRGHF
jgi:hypothetical protein